jgi:hypothetical protein
MPEDYIVRNIGQFPTITAEGVADTDSLPIWDASAEGADRTKRISVVEARYLFSFNSVPLTQLGAPNGVATLDAGGLMPAAQSRPCSVDFDTDTLAFTWADGSTQDAVLSGFALTGHGHGDASGSVAGFMSSADFTKLAGIAAGATANSTDAQLRDRGTHTGTQPTSTITGLDTALAGFALTGHGHSNASGSVAGFMSSVDFTKLAGIAAGATANSTDAQLRDRSTHTGTQPNTTITGLGTLSTQNANSIAVTGGAIDGTAIGATTPGTVVGTTLNGFTVARSATGQAIGSVCTSTGTSWAAIAGNNTTMASTTGSNWIAIGPLAGVASTTGNSWIGLGSGAGRNNTTGSQWIGIGTNTGQSNTTGGNWIGIGANAGASNTTGNNWIGIGVGAGQANVAGSGWTAIGTVAGNANTGGSNWVAVGEGAGTSNTTGTNWAAVGMQSARFNTTGSAFSAFGFRAGTANTTGSGWTALGNQAAFASTTGERFTAVGASSGLNVTTGSDWVAIGHNTMLGVTTGSGNTVIGANVTGLPATLTNNIIIASGDGVQKIRADSAGTTTLLGLSIAPGQFAVPDDVRARTIVARNSTTNATSTPLFLDGASTRLVLANNSSLAYDICVSAHSTTNVAEQATFWRRGKIYRVANAASTTLVPGEIAENQVNGLPWTVTVSADTSNGALNIAVVGEASKNIRWVARINAVEVLS